MVSYLSGALNTAWRSQTLPQVHVSFSRPQLYVKSPCFSSDLFPLLLADHPPHPLFHRDDESHQTSTRLQAIPPENATVPRYFITRATKPIVPVSIVPAQAYCLVC